MSRHVSIVAVMTSFNRKAMTLACLDALIVSARRARVELRGVLVDDASSDGTADAVRERHPWVEVVAGPGDLYWNRGMHRAFGIALAREATHYLWINDDTVLHPDAIETLLSQSAALAAKGGPVILAGATRSRDGVHMTYGGSVAENRWRRLSYRKVWNPVEPVECEVMNGNCVLIARGVAIRVGNLDPAYEHAMGDIDYALRARAAGFRVYVAAGIAGHCESNSVAGTFVDASLPLRLRWKLMRQRKGLPLRSWWRFTRLHGGLAWPAYFVWPYAKLLWTSLGQDRGSRPRPPADDAMHPR